MRISEGVEMLQLTARAFNQDITLNPTLVWNNEEAILIDTGMPGQTNQLKEALNELNMSIEQLKVILLTHQDLDHIGCATDIRNNSDKNIIVYAHEFDKPYIEGKLPLIKTNASRMSNEELAAIPDEIKYLYKNPPKVEVDTVLKKINCFHTAEVLKLFLLPDIRLGMLVLFKKIKNAGCWRCSSIGKWKTNGTC